MRTYIIATIVILAFCSVSNAIDTTMARFCIENPDNYECKSLDCPNIDTGNCLFAINTEEDWFDKEIHLDQIDRYKICEEVLTKCHSNQVETGNPCCIHHYQKCFCRMSLLECVLRDGYNCFNSWTQCSSQINSRCRGTGIRLFHEFISDIYHIHFTMIDNINEVTIVTGKGYIFPDFYWSGETGPGKGARLMVYIKDYDIVVREVDKVPSEIDVMTAAIEKHMMTILKLEEIVSLQEPIERYMNGEIM